MEFKTTQDTFNYYRTAMPTELEQRAAAIKQEIQENANANIEVLNIELEGMKKPLFITIFYKYRRLILKALALYQNLSCKTSGSQFKPKQYTATFAVMPG